LFWDWDGLAIFGCCVTSLRDWLRLSGVSPKEAGRSNKDAKRIRELGAQVRELRKQSTEKDDVIAVLKKSVGRGRKISATRRVVKIMSTFKTLECKYHFVKADTSGLSKDKLCRLLNIFRSACYAWLVRPPSKRSLKDKAILRELVRLHAKYPTFGLDPLHQLVKPLFGAYRKRIHRLKKRANIRSIRHKAYKVTTNSNHNNAVSPNLLGRKFKAVRPNQVWVSDITYIPTGEGWLYCAIVKDLFTKKIVGYATSERINNRACA